MKDNRTTRLSRRRVLKTGGAAAAVLAMPGILRTTRAAESLTIRDAGGQWQTAVVEAFYKPFTKETGIQIVTASAAADPLAQVKAMVEAKSYTWDVVLFRTGAAELLGSQGFMEEINWSGADMNALIPTAKAKYAMGTDVFATVYGYRTDTVKGTPSGWADFWDVKKFPGRRAMQKNAIDTFEQALMADGVPMDKLYPLDIPRALKKLEQIRKDVVVWWSGGAQAAQLLKTGEADFVATWNGRIQPVIDEKAPVKISWNQGLYAVEGWSIPKGNPKRDTCQKFIQFCANPERQAVFSQGISYGPTHPKAFDFIPKERAAVLPTYPDHFKNMVYASHEYWGKNQDKALEEFNKWLLS